MGCLGVLKCPYNGKLTIVAEFEMLSCPHTTELQQKAANRIAPRPQLLLAFVIGRFIFV
jgi:hypothetical protein